MRNLNELNHLRVDSPFPATSTMGAFKVTAGKRTFLVVASVDYDERCGALEHVSVSHKNPDTTPTWDEMAAIKDMLFLPEEGCVQIHPKASEYVNLKKNCLHIWRPVNGVIFGRKQ